jgi:DNA primase
MAVDFDLFMDWAKEYFGDSNIKIRNTSHGTEICTHSIWSEKKLGKTDTKFHLWMNPSGGKSEHPELGSYRCWLTDEMGSLVKLVSQLENMEWDEAEARITGGCSLRDLEQKVHEFFGHKETHPTIPQVDEQIKPKLDLPPSTYLISQLGNHFMAHRASAYLKDRKMSIDGLYVCVAGEFKNRIVIPYYNDKNELVYYNSRLMSDKKDVLRYMKCPTTIVDQKDVLFMTKWPAKGSKIYIQEGEFDAKSLEIAGFIGCACGGKFMSDNQIELIRNYNPVLAFDADEAGFKAMVDIGKALLEKGLTQIYYVRPPTAFKDWNKFLVERNASTIKAYIEKFEKPFTENTPNLLMLNRL